MLLKAHKKLLRLASRQPIEDYFANLQAPVKGNAWLPTRNRYRLKCVDRYKRDLSSKPPRVRHRALRRVFKIDGTTICPS